MPNSAMRGGSPYADIADGAAHLVHRCEGVLRVLPNPGEPELVRHIRMQLGGNDDFQAQVVPGRPGLWILYLATLVDGGRLWEEVANPLIQGIRRRDEDLSSLWPTGRRIWTATMAAEGILAGGAIIVFGPMDGGGCVLHDVARRAARAVGPPKTEEVIVGPKEAFVEDLDTNLALLRGWLPDTTLRVEIVRVGRRSRSRVAVTYLTDVVRPGLVPLLIAGLRRIRTDFIRTDWELAEYLTAGSLTPFPLAEPTERPDKVAQALANGRVAVFFEHSPFPFLVPTTLFEFQTDSEAALPGPVVTGFVRTLRHAGTFLAVAAPGLVVALLSANPGPLRPELAHTLALTRVGLPYPVFPEMFLMMVVVDIFNEATAQAPGGVGNALSIVGTLIIGQISVRARLVSELVMIVAAATSLGAFLSLRYQFNYAVRIWKYPVLLLSGITGLFGCLSGLLLLTIHLASLKSAGVPYLEPLAPLHPRSLLLHAAARRSRPQETRRPPMWEAADPTRAARPASREPEHGDEPPQ